MSGNWSKGHWTNAHWDANNFRGPNDAAATGDISGSASFSIVCSGTLLQEQTKKAGGRNRLVRFESDEVWENDDDLIIAVSMALQHIMETSELWEA